MYLINITETDTGATWQLSTDDENVTVESLHPFYSYSLSVAAQTIALGPFTSPVVIEIPEDGEYGITLNSTHMYPTFYYFITAPSSSPTEVSAATITSVGFSLSWGNPSEMDWNGIIRNFIISIIEANTGLEYQFMTASNEIEVNFLHPFYSYLCSVAAVTVSAGPYSTPLEITTLTAGV